MAPKPLDWDGGAIVKNTYCYILRRYKEEGIGVLYYHQKPDICVQIGDWHGNALDLTKSQDRLVKLAGLYLHQYNLPIYNLLHSCKIPQAQIFLDGELTLVDLQISINKFSGPGMLQNIFGNTIKTPEVLSIDNIDQRVIDAIDSGNGSYSGDLIIKPSRFRHYQLPSQKYVPLQVQVVR